MPRNGSQSSRDAPGDGSGDALVSTLQSTIRTIIAQGTRYGVELKACENMFANSEAHLKQDPNNRTVQAEHANKKAKRDACLEPVDQLANELANKLLGAVRELLNQAQAGPSVGASHLSTLEKQITRIEEEMETKSRQQREAIDQLHQRLRLQSEEIDALKQRLQQQQAQPEDPDKLQLVRMGSERQPTPIVTDSRPEVDSAVGSRPLANDQCFHQNPEMDNRLTLGELANSVFQLQANVVETLTKDIPDNLQRSVRLMQEDVNKAVDASLVMFHEQLSGLVREFVAKLEARIEPLERIAGRYCPAGAVPADPAQSVKEPTPTPAAEQPAPSKDPRLRRRQPALPSHTRPDAKAKPSPQNEAEKCPQQ